MSQTFGRLPNALGLCLGLCFVQAPAGLASLRVLCGSFSVSREPDSGLAVARTFWLQHRLPAWQRSAEYQYLAAKCQGLVENLRHMVLQYSMSYGWMLREWNRGLLDLSFLRGRSRKSCHSIAGLASLHSELASFGGCLRCDSDGSSGWNHLAPQ